MNRIIGAMLVSFLVFSFSMHAEEKDPNKIVEKVIKNFMKNKEAPGVAVALIIDQTPHIYFFGTANKATGEPVTPDTIFEIASITKVFTSTLLAEEVLAGRMNLNDSVTKYLHFAHPPHGQIGKVTLETLATHTSSLPRVPPPRRPVRPHTHESVLEFLANWIPDYPIHTKYVYSNLGYGVLGFAVADAAGRPYHTLLDDNILRPLGMHSTFIRVPKALMHNYAQGYNQHGKPAEQYALNAWPAGGALRSTISDMFKFLKANLGMEGPPRLLKAMQFAQEGRFKVSEHLTLGLGWQRFSTKKELLIDKNGGVEGFSSYIGMNPDKKMGIVILVNKGKTGVTNAGRKILNLLSE